MSGSPTTLHRVAGLLLWGVIAAAFIGPGTVTTCGAAGAAYSTALLWALLFSGVACFTLQEAAARVAIASGSPLAETIASARPTGARRTGVAVTFVAIVVGCAAYEAGNVLGAIAGARLIVDESETSLAWIVGALAAITLASGSAARVSRFMGALVAAMGLAFAWVGFASAPPLASIARGLVVPVTPAGASGVVLALVGTTVVPYNLFLGSSLAVGRTLRESRLGLAVSVGLGTCVSIAIVWVGATLDGPFTFEGVATALERELGPAAGVAFALGLFGAGLSSAVTAPLAASLTSRGLFGGPAARHAAVAALVLAVGVLAALADLAPVPVILTVQALNGILLPAVAVFLVVSVNDRQRLGAAANGFAGNVAIGFSTTVAVVLGTSRVVDVIARGLGIGPPSPGVRLGLAACVATVVGAALVRAVRKVRRPRTGLTGRG